MVDASYQLVYTPSVLFGGAVAHHALIWAGMARVMSQEHGAEMDTTRRKRRSKRKSQERMRMERRWRRQKPENVGSISFFAHVDVTSGFFPILTPGLNASHSHS